MGVMLATCLAYLLNLALGMLTPFVNLMISSLTEYSLGLGDFIDSHTGHTICSSLYSVFAGFGLALLTVTFLKKGFETYIAYTDGDPESDPFELFTLYCKAIVVIAISPMIIDFFSDVVRNLTLQGMMVINNGGDISGIASFEFTADNLSTNMLAGIAVIVYFVIALIFQIMVIGTGVELLVLEIGLPLAAIGLLNQDKGVFKSYAAAITKVFVTIITRILLCHLSFAIVLLSGSFNSTDFMILLFAGIAMIIAAFKMPKLLSEWLVPSGGGQGIMMKAYYASGLISKFRK